MKRSAPSPPQSSPFEALPRYIATSSILSFVTSNDWLNFRLASHAPVLRWSMAQWMSPLHVALFSRAMIIMGPPPPIKPAALAILPALVAVWRRKESESLWRLALIRDYLFDEADDENILHQSIHSPVDPQSDAILSTNNIFTASNSFISWKLVSVPPGSPRGRCIPSRYVCIVWMSDESFVDYCSTTFIISFGCPQ